MKKSANRKFYPFPAFISELSKKKDFFDFNLLHIFAVVIVWGFLIFLLAILIWKNSNFRADFLFHCASVVMGLCGTLWIAAGVIYKKPPKYIQSHYYFFRKHVINTLLSASRHCAIGILLIMCGTLMQIVADLEWTKKLDTENNNLKCKIMLYFKEKLGEAENIRCTIEQ